MRFLANRGMFSLDYMDALQDRFARAWSTFCEVYEQHCIEHAYRAYWGAFLFFTLVPRFSTSSTPAGRSRWIHTLHSFQTAFSDLVFLNPEPSDEETDQGQELQLSSIRETLCDQFGYCFPSQVGLKHLKGWQVPELLCTRHKETADSYSIRIMELEPLLKFAKPLLPSFDIQDVVQTIRQLQTIIQPTLEDTLIFLPVEVVGILVEYVCLCKQCIEAEGGEEEAPSPLGSYSPFLFRVSPIIAHHDGAQATK
jgi:hypothetical protein